jgi:hypothetical protein
MGWKYRSLELCFRLTSVNRWEKAGLRTGCSVSSQVIDVLEAQQKRSILSLPFPFSLYPFMAHRQSDGSPRLLTFPFAFVLQ